MPPVPPVPCSIIHVTIKIPFGALHPDDVDAALADLDGFHMVSQLHVRYENAAYRARRLPVCIALFGRELKRRGLYRTMIKGRTFYLVRSGSGLPPSSRHPTLQLQQPG